MTDTPTFETFSASELADNPLFKVEEKKPDETWTTRVAPLAIGSGFRVHRVEGESVRQLKRRVNAAAGSPEAGFKTLEWKPESRNLPDGQPASWVVKVKAIDIKSKADHDAKQRQNGTQEAAQTTPASEGSTEGTPEEATTQRGPRGR